MAGNANSITSHNSLRGSLSENNLVSGTVGTAYNPTYAIATEAAAQIVLNINNADYKLYAELKDKNGNRISISNTIDLPLETMVVNGEYDESTKEVILTLDNGNEIKFSIADLISGLQSEITSVNMLSSDLVDDNNKVHKFVSTTEKTNWNNKLEQSDLATYVENTDYATNSLGGVFKTSTGNGTTVNQYGVLAPISRTYLEYQEAINSFFISKGTLENVITGKGLVSNTDYATDSVGGVIKVDGANYGSYMTSSGILCASMTSYANYGNKSNNYIISKGTLENVLTAKIGDISSVIDSINGEVI